MSAFCSGFNVNAINRYYQVLKAVSSYCYNETFPFFSHRDCKEATMRAIVVSFDWNEDYRKLENKFNISQVFIDNAPRTETANNRSIKERALGKQKLELFRNIRNSFGGVESEMFIDILNNFVRAFQSNVKDYFIRSERKELSLMDIIEPTEARETKFGCKLYYWLRIVNIALGERQVTMMKSKMGPYVEYFKKIFDKGKDKEKASSPPKRTRQSSLFSLPFVEDNECHTEINIIFDFLIRIVKFTPLYDAYLKDMKIRRDSSNKNKERLI
jgi:hypothetical protein